MLKNACLFSGTIITIVLKTWIVFGSGVNCIQPIPDIYRDVSPSVVFISSTALDPVSVKERIITLFGSGFIITDDGLILTNSHLVFGKRSVAVKLSTGETFPADLVGADPVMDIAVLKIHSPAGSLPKVTFMDGNDTIRIGEEIIVIGSPAGLENTISVGIISGMNRILPTSPMSMIVPMIQTDASVSSGNSGGPLLNRCGEVIGIVTAVLSDAVNIGFALPINLVKPAVRQLIEYGRIKRPWLGVHGKLISKSDIESLFKLVLADGFLVETVESGSPAEKAGIKGGELPVTVAGEEFFFGGDIIVSANGMTFDNPNNFEEFVRSMKIGDTIRLSIFRGEGTREVELIVSEKPILTEIPSEPDSGMVTP